MVSDLRSASLCIFVCAILVLSSYARHSSGVVEPCEIPRLDKAKIWTFLSTGPLTFQGISDATLAHRYQHLGEMMTLGSKDGTVTLNLPGGLTLEGPLGSIGEGRKAHVL